MQQMAGVVPLHLRESARSAAGVEGHVPRYRVLDGVYRSVEVGMRDYKKLYEIVEYCKAFQSQFFEYLTDGIVGGDDTVMDMLEEYADWTEQGFTVWSESN